MLYLAKSVSGTQPSTIAFKERGINLTQARISDVVVIGQPTARQLAYDGYRENIEAFLHATATKKITTAEGSVYSIPSSYIPSVPLPLPQVIFRLAKKTSPESLKFMLDGLEPYGVQRVDVGKGEPSYTLARPAYKHLATNLPAICNATCAFVDNHAQLEGAHAILPIYQCIDLFLATNTYEYRKQDFDPAPSAIEKQNDFLQRIEMRTANTYYRLGYNKDGPQIAKSRKLEKGRELKQADETIDLTPDLDTRLVAGQVVLACKPSPKPSSLNFGTALECPHKGGLLFPYFQGMLVPDSNGLRGLTNQFIRCLGDEKTLPKDAFLHLRKVIGTVATTPQGVILTHVLKGVELALECQAVLFLLFDKKEYQGFVLLGEEFSVYLQGEWHQALTPDKLRSELNLVRTHDQSLEDLAARLKKCILKGGDSVMIPEGGLKYCAQIADLLSKLDLEKEGHEEDENEVSDILARLNFQTFPRTFKPVNIAQSIRYLCLEDSMPEDAYFHIPLKGWSQLSRLEWRVFGQYGVRGFSLRNAKGTELQIPKETKDKNIFEEKENGKFVYPKFLVGEKPISQCIVDWEQFVQKRSMRMDFLERAAGTRNHTFTREMFKPIWDACVDGVAAGVIGTKTTSSAAEKRTHSVAFGSSTVSKEMTW